MTVDEELSQLEESVRRLKIDEFHKGYRETAIRPDEIITRLLIPLPGRDELVRLYKTSKRREMDMTTFRAAIRVARRDEAIEEAVIAYSGIGPVTRRLPGTETFLRGKPFTEETFREAGEQARRELAVSAGMDPRKLPSFAATARERRVALPA